MHPYSPFATSRLKKFVHVAAFLAVLLASLPAYAVHAQDDIAQPVAPASLASLAEMLASAPGLTASPIPEGVELPASIPAEALAQMPDRTKYAVVGYRLEGDGLHATVQLPASQTAYIASGAPDSNFGGDAFINLGWDQVIYNAMRVLIQFDLGSLPANAQINNATFYINQSAITPAGDGQGMSFRAQFMQQAWNASSVTWNSANYLGGQSLPLGDIPPAVGWIEGGATDVVKAWRSGQPNNGLLITGDETANLGRWRQFYSRSIPALAPYILVDYTVNCDTAPPVATMGAPRSFEPAEFVVSWSAFDPEQPGCQASGVDWYNVRYRINGGGWSNWKDQSTSTSNTFKGWAPNGALVEFQVQAADRAGNLGAWSAIVSTRIDAEPPVASVNPLPQFTISPNFTVSWGGVDNLSGIAFYNLQVSKNDGNWQTLLSDTTATSFQVTGSSFGDKFEFRVQAVDNAGNAQPWSPNAQAFTVIFDEPIAVVLRFNPSVIKPTSPITTVIPVSWSTFSAPGTTITEYELRYRYTPFDGVTGNWLTWQTFPGATESANFDYTALGLGNGLYEFYALATNNLGQKQTFNPDNGAGQSVILDLNDQLLPAVYMPFVSNTASD
ncbi:MAG: DNRLRE domain-containing protein [Caldilinea sp.]